MRPWLATSLAAALLLAPAARAVHESGASWEVIGFSAVGSALVRLVDVQHGTLRYEVRATEGGAPLLVQTATPGHDEERWTRALRQEHGIVSPGFDGPRSPASGAVITVVPGPLLKNGAFEYQVELSDGLGSVTLAPIPVENACPPETGAQADLSVHWAPDGRTALVAGAVSVESPCGQPAAAPVLRVVRVRAPAPFSILGGLANDLVERARQLERHRPAEAARVARQAVAMAPDAVGARVLLARLRALSGDAGGALATLWSLVGLGERGLAAAADALDAPWASELRRRAAFAALQWVLKEHRAERGD